MADPRVPALAEAIRGARIVRIRARGPGACDVHPVALTLAADGWALHVAGEAEAIPLAACADINVSARRFAVD